MALPSAEEITNQYLYGQLAKPDDLLDDRLIRPAGFESTMPVNINDYVAGPGRFVTPGTFAIVERFFNPWLYADSARLGQGRKCRTEANLIAQHYRHFTCNHA